MLLVMAQVHSIDYRESLVDMMKITSMLNFEKGSRVTAPSLTQNLPYFHRSNKDFSEIALNIETYMPLLFKGMGAYLGREFEVLAECLYSGFRYERSELSEALKHALEACSAISGESSAETRFCAMMVLATVLAAEGKDAELEEVFENLENMIEKKSAYFLSANLRAFKCRLLLANGDVIAAQDWLSDNSFGFDDNVTLYENYQQFTTARAYITVGNFTNAILVLQKLLIFSERFRRPLDIIEANILLSIAFWKKGQGSQPIALEHLEKAIVIASDYSYTQVFATEGAELVTMLQRLNRKYAQKDPSEKDLLLFVRSLALHTAAEAKRRKGLTGGRIVEALKFTDKQMSVMRLMCDGFERNDIAEKLGVKPYTVKSHLELIYKKLDVSNRVDAVLKIKELGLLSR